MADAETHAEANAAVPIPQLALSIVAMAFVFAALLFLPAGRVDWTRGWVYVGVVIAFVVTNWACLSRWNPVLIRRRMRYGQGTKRWDIVWTAMFGLLMVAVYVVAGLEARRGLVGLPAAIWPLGLAIFVLGSVALTWSMVVNPFFEKTVRIQTDQGHRTIDNGPYAWVRHPGYVGLIGWMVATPLLLGSQWALIPAALSIIAIVIRTALEDRTLQSELTGYAEYAARVRFRLIPGIW